MRLTFNFLWCEPFVNSIVHCDLRVSYILLILLQTDLDMRPFVVPGTGSSAASATGRSTSTSYSLCSVVEHHGRGLLEGHYTAYGRNQASGLCTFSVSLCASMRLLLFVVTRPGIVRLSSLLADAWLLFNDSRVTAVADADVQNCQGEVPSIPSRPFSRNLVKICIPVLQPTSSFTNATTEPNPPRDRNINMFHNFRDVVRI